MSEMSFEQMLEESLKTIHNGEVVEGTVIDVKEDEIILNIGYKADGIITKSEYTNDSSVNLQDVVHVNDKMEAKVLKVNDGEGQVLLTYKRLAAEKGNKRLEEAFENHEVLKADSMTDVTSRDTVRTDTEETADTVRVIRAAAMTTGTMNRMTEENVQQRKRRENGSRLSLKS